MKSHVKRSSYEPLIGDGFVETFEEPRLWVASQINASVSLYYKSTSFKFNPLILYQLFQPLSCLLSRNQIQAIQWRRPL